MQNLIIYWQKKSQDIHSAVLKRIALSSCLFSSFASFDIFIALPLLNRLALHILFKGPNVFECLAFSPKISLNSRTILCIQCNWVMSTVTKKNSKATTTISNFYETWQDD